MVYQYKKKFLSTIRGFLLIIIIILILISVWLSFPKKLR